MKKLIKKYSALSPEFKKEIKKKMKKGKLQIVDYAVGQSGSKACLYCKEDIEYLIVLDNKVKKKQNIFEEVDLDEMDEYVSQENSVDDVEKLKDSAEDDEE